MSKEVCCPVCTGSGRLRAFQKVGLSRKEYEIKCWACRGSGVVLYEEDRRPENLRTIVPADEKIRENEDEG